MAPKSHSAKSASGSKVKSTSSTSAAKIKQEFLKGRKPGLYFVLLCDDYLSHPKNIVISPSATQNHKKIKQELLKSRKPGQYFVLLPEGDLLHSKNYSCTPQCEGKPQDKAELAQEL
jgi:hypothetical protein